MMAYSGDVYMQQQLFDGENWQWNGQQWAGTGFEQQQQQYDQSQFEQPQYEMPQQYDQSQLYDCSGWDYQQQGKFGDQSLQNQLRFHCTCVVLVLETPDLSRWAAGAEVPAQASALAWTAAAEAPAQASAAQSSRIWAAAEVPVQGARGAPADPRHNSAMWAPGTEASACASGRTVSWAEAPSAGLATSSAPSAGPALAAAATSSASAASAASAKQSAPSSSAPVVASAGAPASSSELQPASAAASAVSPTSSPVAEPKAGAELLTELRLAELKRLIDRDAQALRKTPQADSKEKELDSESGGTTRAPESNEDTPVKGDALLAGAALVRSAVGAVARERAADSGHSLLTGSEEPSSSASAWRGDRRAKAREKALAAMGEDAQGASPPGLDKEPKDQFFVVLVDFVPDSRKYGELPVKAGDEVAVCYDPVDDWIFGWKRGPQPDEAGSLGGCCCCPEVKHYHVV
ncbi:unnamed protein product [Polarella glacialis]|uniref:SH3 domain-containing protein n=1 Tax=Polarella glacialis TaxID=89957 RepID=A0A813JJ35_POLGL|nr:unnamed protein product [Polarella glacialis]